MVKTVMRNRHTKGLAEFVKSEMVPNYPNPIRVHTLLFDGKETGWNDEFFFANWVFVNDREFAK